MFLLLYDKFVFFFTIVPDLRLTSMLHKILKVFSYTRMSVCVCVCLTAIGDRNVSVVSCSYFRKNFGMFRVVLECCQRAVRVSVSCHDYLQGHCRQVQSRVECRRIRGDAMTVISEGGDDGDDDGDYDVCLLLK